MSNEVVNKEFSIIIPCYNEEDSITTVVGMLEKNFKNLNNCEIIIVNDGSTDKTLSILMKKNPLTFFKD